MTYEYSELDRKNIGWFSNDFTRATLKSIGVRGKLRGLANLQVDFSYPITAIAGRNGSGKTTILALAACAYGNRSNGYKLLGRKNPFYKHSDFFMQTIEESKLNVRIVFQFLYNKWRSKNPAERVKAGWQSHEKIVGGRWSYSGRVIRTVVYLGIDRIVPDAEKSTSKSYRKHFQPVSAKGWEDDVRKVVGRILGIEYQSFNYKQHSRYRLPVVSVGKRTYSGFNMGAGEEALFELFSIIKELPDGSLVLIDEIELGLHEEAQGRLIEELKILCDERKFQVICTTHSPRILDCLPSEGRIFLEKIGETITVIPGISSAFATGKLSGYPNVELDILVEDEAAKMIIETGLTPEIRSRTKVLPIGSSIAVMRHLASRYKDSRSSDVCVILDGDKSESRNEHIKAFLDALESTKDKAETLKWAEKRLNFLPGEKWPEDWVIGQTDKSVYEGLQVEFSLSKDQVEELLSNCRRAGKHKEFHKAASSLNLSVPIVAYHLIKSAYKANPEELEKISNFVKSFLK